MGLFSWLKRIFGRVDPIDKVPFYDFDSGTVVQIPRSELSSKAIQVRIQGLEGVYWVLADEIRPGPIQHDPFSEDVRDRLRQIQAAFAEHDDLTLEEWEDGFRRDATPDQQIAMWLHAADVYLHFAREEFAPDRRHDIYRCIVTCITTGPDSVWDVFRPKVLLKSQAQQIIDRYFGNAT